MALSAATHHSFDTVAAGETYHGLRAQKMDRARAAHNALRRHTQGAAQGPELFQPFEEEFGAARPGSVTELAPQERVHQHTVEHRIEACPFVHILDALVPQVGRQADGGVPAPRFAHP